MTDVKGNPKSELGIIYMYLMKKVSSIWRSKRDISPIVSLVIGAILTSLLITLIIFFFQVMISDIKDWSTEELFKDLFDVKTKYEVLRFLGISLGGVLLFLQAISSYIRAKAMEDAAKAQAKATEEQAKANENTEKGRRQERLKNAIEHLGHEAVSVRLGGAYELFHLARDTYLAQNTEDLRQTVLDILCAHIRQTTGKKGYQKAFLSKPSEEIQSLLTLLFVQDHDTFKGLHINLHGSWLNGASLERANLERAVLSRAYLQWANLCEAKLQGSDLEFAHLQNARFIKARMQEARLLFANLQGTHLFKAQLQGVILHLARLQGALLSGAYLQGSDLTGVQMQGAELSKAHMEGANLSNAHLEGAFLGEIHLQAANLLETNLRGATCLDRPNLTKFTEHIRSLTGKQSGLSGVIFAGGLTQEDLDSLVEGLSDDAATKLRAKLILHVSKPVSHELPEDSGAILGSYTKEETEQWIDEYKKAMSEVPEEDHN